jgi:hypothetical protein
MYKMDLDFNVVWQVFYPVDYMFSELSITQDGKIIWRVFILFDLLCNDLPIVDTYMFFSYEGQAPTATDLYKHDCTNGNLLLSEHYSGIKNCGSIISFSSSAYIYML